MQIVTLTINPAIDKNTSISKLIPEIKLKCNAPIYEPGGGGINVSRAIKKLGGASLAIFQSGGPSGILLYDLLNQENIEGKAINTSEWTRENLIVSEMNSHRQYRFGMPGPTLTEKEWRQFLFTLEEMDFVPELIVASGSLPNGVPIDFYAKVAKIARKLGAKLILDTSGKALSQTIKQESVFLLKPNLQELCELTGRNEIAGMDHEKQALQLIDEGKAEIVVVSLGAQGAIMATSKGVESVTPPSVLVKSTVGAGDSMVAGLTLAYVRGASHTEMLKYGVACGTATSMSEGTNLCSKENTDLVYGMLGK